MKQILFKVSFLLILSLFMALTLSKASVLEKPEIKTLIASEIAAKKFDPKAEILSKYLAKHNSPLQYHAQDFIDAANQYNLDWKLVTAISGVESTFGKFIPGGYNGWGWGVYGTQAIYFNSWKEAIFTVSKGLRENYVNKGLKDPYSMNRIYAASPAWGGHVSFFMNDLQKFADHNQPEELIAEATSVVKEAANSGLLAFKN